MIAVDEKYRPIAGPMPGTPDWYQVRMNGIFASEAAKALGVSDYGQPLDLYLEKTGLVEPFEGSDYTDRGKRFEPFIAGEYTKQTGLEIHTGLPMYFHPDYPFIGATPDAVVVSDPLHGAEFKACNWRRAAQLGDPDTDDIFADWLIQAQQQMFVMGWARVDVFVMVDLHTYRSYRVVRNNDLIGQMIPKLVELWRRIETRQAPEPDFGHSGTLDLLKKLHQPSDEIVQFDDVVASAWARRQQLKESIKLLDAEADAIDAKVLYGLGTASVGRLPLGQREISVCTVKDSLWVPEDIDKAVESQGKVKRRGHVRLLERKAQGPKGRKGSVA